MRPQERATELQGAAPKLEVRKGFEKGDKPKTLPKQMAQTEGQAGVCTPTDPDPDPGTAGEGAAAREAAHVLGWQDVTFSLFLPVFTLQTSADL